MDEEEIDALTEVRFGAERHPENHAEMDTSDPDWWDLDAQ